MTSKGLYYEFRSLRRLKTLDTIGIRDALRRAIDSNYWIAPVRWDHLTPLLDQWIHTSRVLHSCPDECFDATHPR